MPQSINMRSFFRILPLCFLFSCTSKAQECKALFLEANRTYEKYLFSRNFSDLDSALLFVDQALKCAPETLQTKLLKVRILSADKKYRSALEILRSIDPANINPDINTMKGFTFEVLNLYDTSALYFQRALNGYTEWLKSDSTNYSHLLKYLHVVYKLKGSEEFRKEADKFESLIIQNSSTPNVEKTLIMNDFKKRLIESFSTGRDEN